MNQWFTEILIIRKSNLPLIVQNQFSRFRVRSELDFEFVSFLSLSNFEPSKRIIFTVHSHPVIFNFLKMPIFAKLHSWRSVCNFLRCTVDYRRWSIWNLRPFFWYWAHLIAGDHNLFDSREFSILQCSKNHQFLDGSFQNFYQVIITILQFCKLRKIFTVKDLRSQLIKLCIYQKITTWER